MLPARTLLCRSVIFAVFAKSWRAARPSLESALFKELPLGRRDSPYRKTIPRLIPLDTRIRSGSLLAMPMSVTTSLVS